MYHVVSVTRYINLGSLRFGTRNFHYQFRFVGKIVTYRQILSHVIPWVSQTQTTCKYIVMYRQHMHWRFDPFSPNSIDSRFRLYCRNFADLCCQKLYILKRRTLQACHRKKSPTKKFQSKTVHPQWAILDSVL